MKEKVKEFIVKKLKWIILFICLIGFLAIAEDVFNKEIMNTFYDYSDGTKI